MWKLKPHAQYPLYYYLRGHLKHSSNHKIKKIIFGFRYDEIFKMY